VIINDALCYFDDHKNYFQVYYHIAVQQKLCQFIIHLKSVLFLWKSALLSIIINKLLELVN